MIGHLSPLPPARPAVGHRPRILWILIATLLAVGLLIAVAIAIYQHRMTRAEERLAQREAEARALDQPVTLDELEAFYPWVEPEENAAFPYVDAFNLLDTIDPWTTVAQQYLNRIEKLEPGETLPADWMEALGEYLRDCAPVFDLIAQGSDLEQSRYHIDFHLGMRAQLLHLDPLRGAARISSLRSFHAAHHGDVDLVVESHRQMLQLANSLRMDPYIMSQLVRLTVYWIEVTALARDLSIIELPRDALDALQDLHSVGDIQKSAVRAYIGERCLLLAHTQRYVRAGPARHREPASAGYWVVLAKGLRLLSIEQQINIFNHFDTLIELEHRPWTEWVQTKSSLEQIAVSLPYTDLYLRQMLPAIARSCAAFPRHAMDVRMAHAALAIERYRLDHGALPETLDDLVPDYLDTVPEDAFDGAPIRYRRTEPGYVLYSVYTDLKDDGGVKAEKDEQNNWIGDWVFEVQR
jgi:hypothetical protein